MDKLTQPTVKTIRTILLNLKQSEMADAINRKSRYYRDRENGLKKWELDDIQAIIKLSGLTFDQIQWKRP